MSFSFSELDFLKPELGAEYTGSGTHFAVFSAHAEQIELCLFSPDGKKEVARMPLPKREGDIWSGYIAGVGPGTVYGYRAHGPYDPQAGHRFNPNKLLLDPYAKQVTGDLKWDDALFGYTDRQGRSFLRRARQRALHGQGRGAGSGFRLGG